jgi:2-dehydropantoate 2-reductase
MDAVHILGAGGIGCAVGYALAGNGLRVTFVDPSAERVADGTQSGVRVDARPARRATFVPFAGWAPPPGAVVLLCTKCYDNAAALARLPDGVSLVPIQNGFDPALLGRPAHLEGVASFVSECVPGRAHTRITRPGKLHLGVAGTPGDDGPRLRGLLRDLSAGLRGAPFRVAVVPDILPYKHTKLMYNAAISPLASAAGIDNGEILRQRSVRQLFFRLLRENYAVLRKAGVALGTIGPLPPRAVAAVLAQPWLADALAWAFYPGLRGTYCSMANDLPAGRTEVENYNGHLIRLAAGGPCPLNRAVYDLVRRMEANRLPPGPERLEELRRALESGPGADPAGRVAG